MYRYQRETGAATLDMLVSPGVAFSVESLRVHLSAAPATVENLVVSAVSPGTVYNVVLLEQAMAAVTDLHWQPARPIPFMAGSGVRVAWSNAATRTYGCEVVFTGNA